MCAINRYQMRFPNPYGSLKSPYGKQLSTDQLLYYTNDGLTHVVVTLIGNERFDGADPETHTQIFDICFTGGCYRALLIARAMSPQLLKLLLL